VEGNVRDNRDLETWREGGGTTGPIDVSQIEPQTSDVGTADFPDDVLGTLSPFARPGAKTLFCDPLQRRSNVKLDIEDQFGNPIETVRLKFGCGPHLTCSAGTIRKDDETNTTSDTIQLPVCLFGGLLSLDAVGYQEVRINNLSTTPDENLTLSVTLPKFTKLNATVTKVYFKRIVYYRDCPRDWDGTYDIELVPFDSTVQRGTSRP